MSYGAVLPVERKDELAKLVGSAAWDAARVIASDGLKVDLLRAPRPLLSLTHTFFLFDLVNQNSKHSHGAIK